MNGKRIVKLFPPGRQNRDSARINATETTGHSAWWMGGIVELVQT